MQQEEMMPLRERTNMNYDNDVVDDDDDEDDSNNVYFYVTLH